MKTVLSCPGSPSKRAAVTWNLPKICLIFVSYKMKIEPDCPWNGFASISQSIAENIYAISYGGNLYAFGSGLTFRFTVWM